MALIDSENAFKERCDRLDPQLLDLLKAQDIKSFSSLGFAVGSPQAPVEEAEFSTFSEKVFGAGAMVALQNYVDCTLSQSRFCWQTSKTKWPQQNCQSPPEGFPLLKNRRGWNLRKTALRGYCTGPNNNRVTAWLIQFSAWSSQVPFCIFLQANVIAVNKRSSRNRNKKQNSLWLWKQVLWIRAQRTTCQTLTLVQNFECFSHCKGDT